MPLTFPHARLQVYAQRHPHLLRLLDSEDELFFLISVFLERQSLLNSSASFAESLYSLRRVPHSPSAAVGDAAGTAKGGQAALSPSQRRNSLILITLLPFLKAKVDALYVNARQQAQQAQHGGSSWAVPPAASAAATSPASAPAAPSPRDLWRKRAVAAFLKVYPWVNAAHEGSKFFYQLIYLVGKSPYFSPELHLLGLVVARVSGQDAAAAAQQRDARHTARLSRARGGPGGSLLSLLRVAWVRATTAVGEHTRSALILTVFAFKVRNPLRWMQWVRNSYPPFRQPLARVLAGQPFPLLLTRTSWCRNFHFLHPFSTINKSFSHDVPRCAVAGMVVYLCGTETRQSKGAPSTATTAAHPTCPLRHPSSKRPLYMSVMHASTHQSRDDSPVRARVLLPVRLSPRGNDGAVPCDPGAGRHQAHQATVPRHLVTSKLS